MRTRSRWITLAVTGLALALAPACKKEEKGNSGASATKADTSTDTEATGAAKPTPVKPAIEKKPAPPPASYEHEGMLDPSKAAETAPDTYKVKFETSKGDFVVEVTRKWSPSGADRFYNLVKIGYFTDVKFFRAVDRFMVQFGIHGDPAVNAAWRGSTIQDDMATQSTQSNKKGYVTFAKARAPNTRSTQLFVNFKDNTFLDKQGFTPIGQVVEGMEVVESLEKKYGETPSRAQGQIQMQGNAFLDQRFPDLDSIKKASLVE